MSRAADRKLEEQEESELSLLPSHRDSRCNSLHDSEPAVATTTRMPTTKGLIRAYWLGALLNFAGFQFGYDSGIVGGVLTLKSFQNDFRYTAKQNTLTQSLAVSLQQAGAFVACLLVWPLVSRLGRKYTLALASFVFIIGCMIETINTHSRSAFYVGRVIAGLGLGSATVIVPMFSSEMMPKEIRGKVGCFLQFSFTFGVLLSYWVDYGVSIHVASKTLQWQIPIGLQIIPAGIIGLGVLTVPESVRWLIKKGRYDEAWRSLTWIRGSDGPEVQQEMDEIRAGVDFELQKTEGFTLVELFKPQYFKLCCVAFIMFLFQQSTGATAFAYYGPQYFKLVASGNTNTNLLLTGIFGAVKVLGCGFFIFLLANRLGRRIPLIAGAAIMGVIFMINGAVNVTHPPTASATAPVPASGKAAVALVYLFVIVYNMSWGPLPWPYVSEIMPTRIREPGIAVGVASQWLFSFVYTLSNPYMINGIKYGTLFFWGACNLVIAVIAYFLVRETQGLSLEEINAKFDGTEALLQAKVSNETEGCYRDNSSDGNGGMKEWHKVGTASVAA